MNDAPQRRLPPVHAVADHPELATAVADRGRAAVVRAARAAIDEARRRLAGGEAAETAVDRLARRVALLLEERARPHLRPVINATGILIHTGLGRSPLAAEAAEAVDRVVRGYCNLEFDLETGERGRRSAGVADLLRELTGAEAATVVNNNAAATVLALRALALGREVIVARGQLVEIGGSYRLPDIFEVSGARLREVGTTNKVRLADYERAISPDTAAILRVHPSNFRVVGFTEEVGIADLAQLARARELSAIDDIGSGAIDSGRPPVVVGEPTIAEGLDAGADLVLCSGDKLLGGPQCGLLLGSKAAVGRVTSDPLARAVRVDKMTLAALEATLRLALDPATAASKIPLWSFLSTPVERLRDRAGRLAEALRIEHGLAADVVDSTAYLGGGSLPVDPIPSAAVRIGPPFPAAVGNEAGFARALRRGKPPVVPRVQGGAVLLDLRAVAEGEEERLREAIRSVLEPPPVRTA